MGPASAKRTVGTITRLALLAGINATEDQPAAHPRPRDIGGILNLDAGAVIHRMTAARLRAGVRIAGIAGGPDIRRKEMPRKIRQAIRFSGGRVDLRRNHPVPLERQQLAGHEQRVDVVHETNRRIARVKNDVREPPHPGIRFAEPEPRQTREVGAAV